MIPSATVICLALGLGEHLVGITHCCHKDIVLVNDKKKEEKEEKKAILSIALKTVGLLALQKLNWAV